MSIRYSSILWFSLREKTIRMCSVLFSFRTLCYLDRRGVLRLDKKKNTAPKANQDLGLRAVGKCGIRFRRLKEENIRLWV